MVMNSIPGLDVSEKPCPLWHTIAVASVAAGVQFGWALQLSLLTPYSQHLGIPHVWSSFIWLCGPISGMFVQPIVGYTSDRSTSRFGRRKPFIAVGSALISSAVLLIGYALDLGMRMGDRLDQETKPRAVALFVVGFWILDIANNMVQDPTRAFLADLSKHNHRRIRVANACFSFFMAVGNILGYLAGSYDHLYKLLPFTKTDVCDIYCANLKTCFFIDIVFLVFLSTMALVTVSEPEFDPSEIESDDPFVEQVKSAFKNLGKPMWILFLVTALNWIAWFPFVMFDTDWVGSEVFGGKVTGTPEEEALYDAGVRYGSLGLTLMAITLGIMSLFIDLLSKALNGGKKLWGVLNFVLAASLGFTALVTKKAKDQRRALHLVPPMEPRNDIKAATLTLFAATGIPQAVTYCIPFALASMFSSDSGAGHGLSLGVLNLAIVIPQMLVSLVSGPLDSLFGGGNIPGFVLGAISAALSGILALTVLPSPSSRS
ncbi:hypothetical protein V2J09_010298 [Rumex salicifolius]